MLLLAQIVMSIKMLIFSDITLTIDWFFLCCRFFVSTFFSLIT